MAIQILTLLFLQNIAVLIDKNYDDDAVTQWRTVIYVSCSILAIVFAVYGAKILSTLKSNFNSFYRLNTCKLIFATTGLTVPLIFRVVWDLLIVYDKRILHDISKNGYYMDFIFFLLCYLLPISLQFSSMIFGYINKMTTTTTQTAAADLDDNLDSLSDDFSSANYSFFDPILVDGAGIDTAFSSQSNTAYGSFTSTFGQN